MSQVSLASPSAALPPGSASRRPGLWLSLTLFAAVIAAGASAFYATRPFEHTVTPAAVTATLEAATRPSTPNQPPLALPGFQRRGPLLTGEVRTGDGSTLRLVIDSRTHAIVGYRIVEPATAQNR